MSLPGDMEAPLHTVQLTLCGWCLNGAGGQCHTPGCALYMNRAPDVPIQSYAHVFESEIITTDEIKRRARRVLPPEAFASYCPHCHTGDPGEDYCGSCGEAI